MGPGSIPFEAHLELLHAFLGRRGEIVERIQALLNAQRKPVEYLQDAILLSRHIEDCFFIGVTEHQARLRGQLEEAHWHAGFKPRDIPGLHNGPADAAELMVRAFYMWRQTRWPGRNGRVRYAHTLFNLSLIRSLELLTMRVWDGGTGGTGERLAQVQDLLDRLWVTNPSDQPVLVRDARWLLQLAQSLATDDLGAYFRVAKQIADSFSQEDRLAIHAAGVRMAGGHLRSQIRYHATKKGTSLDETRLVQSTRTTNALDFALLVQDLVPLLAAYEQACRRGDASTRRGLADAICQGISPDPELLVNRLDLLGPYSMIEHLFVTTDDDGDARYTPMGSRHVALLKDYTACIGRVAHALAEDLPHFRPVAGSYSPYGVIYGFSSDLLKHMALKASQPDAVNRFGLEDVFVAGGPDKLAWVSGWRKLPHLSRDVEKLFDYPQPFAEEVYHRIEQALRRRVADDESNSPVHRRRLIVAPADTAPSAIDHPTIPGLPAGYVRTSTSHDELVFLKDRQEGKFLVSYRTDHGWVGISKDILIELVSGAGDVAVVGLPAPAARVLGLMCPPLTGPEGPFRSPDHFQG